MSLISPYNQTRLLAANGDTEYLTILEMAKLSEEIGAKGEMLANGVLIFR